MSDSPSKASQGFEVAHMGPPDPAGAMNEPIDVASDDLAALHLTGNEGDQPAMEYPALSGWPTRTMSPGLHPPSATRLMGGTRISGSSGAGSIAGSRSHADSSDAGSVSSAGRRRGGIGKRHKRNKGTKLTGAAEPSVVAALHQVETEAASDIYRAPSGTSLGDGSGTVRDGVATYQSQGYLAQLQSPSNVPNSPLNYGFHAPDPNTPLYGNGPSLSQGTSDLGGAAFSSPEPGAQWLAPDPVSNPGFMDSYWRGFYLARPGVLRASAQDQPQNAFAPQAHSTPPATILPASSPSQYSQTVGGNEPPLQTDTYLSQPYPNYNPHADQASVAYPADYVTPDQPYFPQASHFDQTYGSANDSAIIDADLQANQYDYNYSCPAQPVAGSYAPVWDPARGAYVFPDELSPAPGFRR